MGSRSIQVYVSPATLGAIPALAAQGMVPGPEDRSIPFPQLPFRPAGAPSRRMGVKVMCQSKVSNLVTVC